MEKLITGFQWSPVDGRYIGEYQFPDNLDKEEHHLPPLTTLERPPEAPEGHSAFRRDNAWVIEIDPAKQKTRPVIEDYAMLTDAFIQHLKDQGLWSEEDQVKRDTAYAEYVQKQKDAEAAAIAAIMAREGGAA